MAGVTVNPFATTGITDGFNVTGDGLIAGVFLDDPAIRYQLESGLVSSSQSNPIYGGQPLTLTTPAVNTPQLGSTAIVAANAAGIMAWCLLNQAANGIVTGSSQVPLFSSLMTLNFARTGTNMRIVLPLNPTAVNTYAGEAPNVAIYWDFTNNRLDSSGTGALPIIVESVYNTNCATIAYSGGNATWVYSGNAVAVVRI